MQEHTRDRLADVELFVLDMDGTIYLGERLFPWTLPFLERVRESGRRFRFMTNNSSKSGLDYVAKLRRLGVPVDDDAVYTSGQAATEWLARRGDVRRVHIMGTPALEAEFRRAGFELVDEAPDWLVMGFDDTLTYAKLERFAALARAGVPYLATHPDLVCPTERGPVPDIGGTIAFMEAVAGRRPDPVIGKPSPAIFRILSEASGVPLSRVAVIGDRLYTDIAGARAAGALAILVLSGEAAAADLEGAEARPDLVIQDLSELTPCL
jgi:HAD superfamily hydrolase (TIGR01450 family)